MERELVISICSIIIAVFACIAAIITAIYTRKAYVTQNKGYIGIYCEGYYVGKFVKKIVIKNYGNSPAEINKISVKGIDNQDYLKKFFNAQIDKIYMPNQISTCIILPDNYELVIELEYSYKSMNRKETQYLTIDLSNTNKELYTKVEDLDNKFQNEILTALNQLFSKI
ncbi:MAG TPA: hypothetical protein DEB65_08945 [Staphylococcus sp.]|uniref:hypothetical protein n=1 Tax=Mammaliicoccus lentus TaxID=42858 RepID=UPI000CD1E954|nr:hypothetical protein [Mammaliicoccus lentus]POA03750.1 hypothetical protein CD135_09915 [Mammaliicoccus lentus]SUM50668.1 Uncharacterised protein [Mammaliicoccus lentus]HBV04385.1 hypothetical protein [Staphylococcus sp.]